MKRGKEVWKARVKSFEHANEKTYYVFATSAAQAERRGLAVTKLDSGGDGSFDTGERVFVVAVEFHCYVY